MKSNFSLKFKLFDIFVIAFVLVAIVTSIVTTDVNFLLSLTSNNKEDYIVQIYYQSELLEEMQYKMKDIDEEEVIILKNSEYDKLLGDVVIKINVDKGICISDATCPNGDCMKMGWVKFAEYPIMCLPNNVMVKIITKDIDKDIVLG